MEKLKVRNKNIYAKARGRKQGCVAGMVEGNA